ncbi:MULTISPECIES: DUF721 domain-containing protein [Prochlorococcus]|uniref:DUF721 domain-containing protein n=1 Tax=Prochlorococcus TaxID=1218 RepID=UPI0005339F5E|nr:MULTISPECIES: DUF721 domain-containing protein [Prochlorococcus]KGG12965.1 hypothetical protein EV05_0638 [Prochlorococcus sp. MIT 0601]
MNFSHYQQLTNLKEEERLTKGDLINCPSSLSSCLDNLQNDFKRNKRIASLWQDWPKIAGKDLSLHCKPLSINRGVLTIGASHPQWIQALIFNKTQLLAALKAKGHEVKSLKIQSHYVIKADEKQTEQTIWKNHPSRIDIHGIKTCVYCNRPSPAGEISLWGKCSLCRRKEL